MADEIKTLVDYIQAAGFVGLLIVLAIPKLRKLVGFSNGDHTNTEEIMADVRNALQPLLSRMDGLENYGNHTVTEHLTQIAETQKNQCKKLDKVVEHMESIRVDGVRIRN